MLLHDIDFHMEFATIDAREASFAPPSKRSKTGGWPHKTPKPADLAKAGFYFKPSAQSSDNAVCFMCSRNLDGWEKDDDPIEEHFKHAQDCGWALIMSLEAEKHSNPSEMDDPTEERVTAARRATFAIGWPHESKRAWTCKIDKMVEAGWHFAPTSESEDYVSCAYCKLSLDGWEPKDNPFEEHYSRSPECPFFIFAGTTAPSKRPKAKKGRPSRVSKASRASTRLSTQSNVALQIEENDIPDLEESLDTSNMSLMSTVSTATTKGKGKRKATATKAKTVKPKKARTTKSKKKETTPEPELEPDVQQDQEQPVTQEEEIVLLTQIEPPNVEEEAEKPKPRSKRTKAKKVEEETIVAGPPLSPVESLGPPEREASVVPVLASSPIPVTASFPRKSLSTIPPAQPTEIATKSSVTKQATPPPLSPQNSTSDIENAPPSTRPKSVRPPLSSTDKAPPVWSPVDIEMIFESTPAAELIQTGSLPEAQQQMTVQDWVRFIAAKAEDDLRNEGERVVGIFEREGQNALKVLEGVACI